MLSTMTYMLAKTLKSAFDISTALSWSHASTKNDLYSGMPATVSFVLRETMLAHVERTWRGKARATRQQRSAEGLQGSRSPCLPLKR